MKNFEYREAFDNLTNKMQDLNDKVSAEKREMTAEESAQFNAWEREATMLKNKAQMAAAESNVKATRENKSVVAQIREAMKEGKRSITVQGYTDAQSQAVAGVHDQLVPTEVEGILDPLYTNSVLGALGVRFYPGLPQGDIRIPVMGKNTIGWAGEISAATESGNTFTAVTLKPNRLSAYVDISKQLLAQDTVGAEQAIMKDLVKAIGDKLEATIFGYGHADGQPDGMFYNKTLGDANTFAKVIAVEGGLEDACVNLANCKYLLSPKAKATFRTMATNGNGSPRVLTAGEIDGTAAVTSANVVDSNATSKGAYIYGDWSNLAVASWGNVEITIDPYSQAVNGCVRLVVNAFFDAKVLRSAAFAYGDARHA